MELRTPTSSDDICELQDRQMALTKNDEEPGCFGEVCTGGVLPFDGFLTCCTSLYTGKRRLFAIPYRLGHLSTLRLFWGLLGTVRGILTGAERSHMVWNARGADAPGAFYLLA
jgi:hypothetical protein